MTRIVVWTAMSAAFLACGIITASTGRAWWSLGLGFASAWWGTAALAAAGWTPDTRRRAKPHDRRRT